VTALRKLVLGETRALPAAVAVLLVGALVLRALAPDLWDDAGGFLLLAGAVVALTAALPRRQPRTPALPTAPVSPTQATQP
jgi:hypothetical protein